MSLTLVDAVKTLHGGPLTEEQIKLLNTYQSMFELSDDDPAIQQMALTGLIGVRIDGLLSQWEQRIKETIELHQQTLRAQSDLVARETVMAVSNSMARTKVFGKFRWAIGGLCFVSGLAVAALLFFFRLHH